MFRWSVWVASLRLSDTTISQKFSTKWMCLNTKYFKNHWEMCTKNSLTEFIRIIFQSVLYVYTIPTIKNKEAEIEVGIKH